MDSETLSHALSLFQPLHFKAPNFPVVRRGSLEVFMAGRDPQNPSIIKVGVTHGHVAGVAAGDQIFEVPVEGQTHIAISCTVEKLTGESGRYAFPISISGGVAIGAVSPSDWDSWVGASGRSAFDLRQLLGTVIDGKVLPFNTHSKEIAVSAIGRQAVVDDGFESKTVDFVIPIEGGEESSSSATTGKYALPAEFFYFINA